MVCILFCVSGLCLDMYPYLRLVTHFEFSIVGPDQHGHETALELVSGANIGGVLHRFSSPIRWNGSRGQVRPETGQKPYKL